MSIARHHAEWLSLVETSGPFLSMPVIMRAFPQGLDAFNSETKKEMRLAFEEWETHRDDPAIHHAWIKFIFNQVLEFPNEVLAEGQSIPAGIEARMSIQGETLRPDLAIITPECIGRVTKPALLIQILSFHQDLDKPLAGKHWKASPATL